MLFIIKDFQWFPKALNVCFKNKHRFIHVCVTNGTDLKINKYKFCDLESSRKLFCFLMFDVVPFILTPL